MSIQLDYFIDVLPACSKNKTMRKDVEFIRKIEGKKAS